MGKKIKLTADLKSLLMENGIDHADFLSYLTNNSMTNNVSNNKQEFTVLNIIDEFIYFLNRNELLEIKSSNTTKYYISFLLRFKQYIEEQNKDLLFKNLNEIIFYDFINESSGIKLKHSSINTYIRIIKRLCTFATENDYCTKNINYKFNLLSFSALPRYFNQNHLKAIFTETMKHKSSLLWKTIFITFLGTGFRIHELSALKIKDLDFKGNLIFTLGKGNKERYVPLYPSIKKEILNYLKLTGVTDLNLAKDGYLFSRLHGYNRNKPISIRSIQENFKNIVKPLNLDSRFTIHSFRHTFAVNCLKVNMQPVYLSQILGHSSLSTTDIYTKLVPNDLQKVIDEKYPFPFEKLIEQIFSAKDGLIQ